LELGIIIRPRDCGNHADTTFGVVVVEPSGMVPVLVAAAANTERYHVLALEIILYSKSVVSLERFRDETTGYISIPTQRPLKGARTRNVARRAAVCDVMSGRLGLVPSATFQVSRILYSWILRDLIHHPSISKKSAGVVASTDRVEPLPVILFKLWQNSSDSRP
jgi:hypothetical protein